MKSEQKLLKEYLKYEKIKGRREQGLIGMRSRVPKLFFFLYEQGLSLTDVKVRHALSYQGWLTDSRTKKGNKYSSRTIVSYIIAATGFYDFLKLKGIVFSNPFKEIRKVRAAKLLPRNILKEKEMNIFLDKLSHFEEGRNLKEKITRYKVHVISELMYGTGLRISEVAGLKVCDIDFARGLVNVSEGKGGYSRVAYLNEYALCVLKLYVEKVRPVIFSEWNMRNSSLLFGVKWRTFIKVINRTLNRLAGELKMEGFTSHGFRHALGYHLHRAGCNIRYIQAILGHRKLRNTEIYVKIDKENLKEALDNYHPRTRWKNSIYEKT